MMVYLLIWLVGFACTGTDWWNLFFEPMDRYRPDLGTVKAFPSFLTLVGG